MTSYEQLKNAVNTIRPALEGLDRDLAIHALTICVDRYADNRNMSCAQKCELVAEIYHNFVELKNNV